LGERRNNKRQVGTASFVMKKEWESAREMKHGLLPTTYNTTSSHGHKSSSPFPSILLLLLLLLHDTQQQQKRERNTDAHNKGLGFRVYGLKIMGSSTCWACTKLEPWYVDLL
jgi:hypothetical protein